MRKIILAGNWKMNKTPAEAEALLKELRAALPQTAHTVAVFPPYLALERAVQQGEGLLVGAQNCHYEASGAFTGEVSLPMLGEIGIRAVLIGHSERRQYFGETDETVNKKTKAALAAGITPFVCIGETLAERQAGGYLALLADQLKAALEGVSAEQARAVVVAYEPVWAIGTGVTAGPAEAEEVCAMLRRTLADLYDRDTAEVIPLLYGGSMNAKNAAELLSMPDIDGGLIGGASLKAADFSEIVKAASR
ncbi:MAG: triose-phosphate isomerase [Clostridia bacterium]|nr:triose-phosphate isomerase [Clostridia bacterium]